MEGDWRLRETCITELRFWTHNFFLSTLKPSDFDLFERNLYHLREKGGLDSLILTYNGMGVKIKSFFCNWPKFGGKKEIAISFSLKVLEDRIPQCGGLSNNLLFFSFLTMDINGEDRWP